MTIVVNVNSFQERAGLSRVEYAYQKIKSNITSNTYPSGFQVLEPELAAQLGVSRTPVREALIRLEADHLIQLIPRRGMRVLPLNTNDIVEINQLAMSMELVAIERICAPHSDNDLSHAEQAFQSMRNALETGDNIAWVDSEDLFLIELARLTENYRMVSMLRNLYDQFRRAKFLMLEFISSREEFVLSRRRLLLAIKEKDVVLATTIHHEYRETINRLYLDMQEKYELKEI